MDIAVPAGRYGPERLDRIGREVAARLLTESDAVAPTVASFREWTRVLVSEVPGWFAGEGEEPFGFTVTVTVPGLWRKEVTGHFIARVTEGLAAAVPESADRIRREPAAWVQVVGVPEGGLGVYGRSVGSAELAELMSAGFRDAADRDGLVGRPPEGMSVDPTCGAIVPEDSVLTAVYGGVRFGYCCTDCRDAHAVRMSTAGAMPESVEDVSLQQVTESGPVELDPELLRRHP
ncbi:hypothetical protein [Stackebrandtia albiflava]|uniref:hypothetical protein n=1 Tax=Stackebrandtia albiflava TaxID=406432 RepID=UPI0011BDE6DD|nr:hypothetical protein [Stackebrandtia albiflava]